MVKRHTYTVSKVDGQVVLTYEDQGVRHRVEHQLPEQPSADAQERNLYRNMPRKEKKRTITAMLQPLLRPHSEQQSLELSYKHLSKSAELPVGVF